MTLETSQNSNPQTWSTPRRGPHPIDERLWVSIPKINPQTPTHYSPAHHMDPSTDRSYGIVGDDLQTDLKS